MGAFKEGLCVIRLISIETCKWDIVNASNRVKNPIDFAEVTGTEAVMAFHSHNLGDSCYVLTLFLTFGQLGLLGHLGLSTND